MRLIISSTLALVLAGAGLAAPVVTMPVAASTPVKATQWTIPFGGKGSAATWSAAGPIGAAGSLRTAAVKPSVVTTPQMSTDEFLAAGVTWDGDEANGVSGVDLRVRENGTWGPWTALGVETDIDAGDIPGARFGSEPLLSFGADGVQARVETTSGRAPAGLRIDLIDPGTSDADGNYGSEPAGTAQAATGYEIKPKVITRAQWGADERKAKSWPQISAKLNAIYVHHTVNSNSYTEKQAAQMIRGIYGYHTSGMGWPDIGYQFLVDKFGNIYQGRQNAIDDLPVGAQAGGYNTTTIGVSALGRFDKAGGERPTAALVTGIEKVVAWKAYQHGVNVTGTTKLTAGISSKSGIRAKPGQTSTVPTVMGHKHTNITACPGEYLEEKLATIRKNAKKRVNAALAKHGQVKAALSAPKVVKAASSETPVQESYLATYKWAAVKGAAKYQILTRSGSHGYPLADDSGWTVYGTVTGTQASIVLSPGQTRYLAVRGVAASGARGAIAMITQTTRPVSAGAIGWSAKHWKKASGAGQIDGVLRTTKSKGATAQATAIYGANRVVAYGRSGPGYGRTQVVARASGSSKDTILGEFSWDSSTNLDSAKRTLTLSRPVNGTVRLISLDAKPVALSTLAFPRSVQGRPIVPTSPTPPAPPAAVVPGPPLAAPVLAALSGTKAPARLGRVLTYKWKSVPGSAAYEVRVRTAANGKKLGSWKSVARATSQSYTLSINRGQTAVVAVRAIPSEGQASTWAQFSAVTRPVTAKTLVKSTTNVTVKKKVRGKTVKVTSVRTAWPKIKHKNYYSGFVYTTTKQGASIKLPRTKYARSVQVVASPGKGQGRIAVYAGSTMIKTINLSAAKHSRVVRYNVGLPNGFSGTITVKTLDSKKVRVSSITAAR